MNPYPRTWIDIDLPRLADNLNIVRRAIPEGCRIALVVKADAYGHGLVPVARFAAQGHADWLCVATVQEGLALRDAGIPSPILVISPILPVEAEQAVFYDLRVVVERHETAQALSAAATHQGKPARVHLEVDTGLARFGCKPEEAPTIADQIRALPSVELEGLCHHYVDSGNNEPRTKEQSAMFREVAARVGEVPLLHSSNSAGAIKFSDEAYSMVRIGILAYGIDPYDLASDGAAPLLNWKARITALRTVSKGATVSYSETYRCQRETVIATLGVGYGDGYPRSLSSRGIVCIGGIEAPIIGLVCMDQMLIDITNIQSVHIGDEVDLIGGTVTVERLATLAQTNCHEITTRIMSRVPRRYNWG